MAPRLRFVDVSCRFRDRLAVHAFTLDVEAGEIVCLLGPSGSGKTTALRLAAGLERVSAGQIAIDGETVSSPSLHIAPEHRSAGLMFQDFALFPHLTVAENVAFGLRRVSSGERGRRAMELLDKVGLASFARTYPHRLSGGEQQRVALARALAPEPRILLMDEPFSGLDPWLRSAIREETRNLLRALGTTALLVTHDAEEAMRMADRIALIREGTIIQCGTPNVLYDRPADRDAARFFGEINVMHSHVVNGEAETVLGRFAAGEIGEGAEVEVLLRPHAFTLGVNDGGLHARLLNVQRMGGETLAEVEIGGQTAKARFPGAPNLTAGTAVTVNIDPSRVTVVPCKRRRAPA